MTAKPILYACAALLLLAADTARGQAAGRPPCGACVRIGVHPDAWTPADWHRAAVAVVRAEVLAGGASLPDARTVAVLLPDGLAGRELAFVARRALAQARGLRPATTLGVLGSSGQIGALAAQELAAYAEFAAATDGSRVSAPGFDVWIVRPWSSLLDALAHTRAADGGTVLLWPPPPATPELLGSLDRLAELLPAGLVPIELPGAACAPAGRCAPEAYRLPDGGAMVDVRRTQGPGPATFIVHAARAELFAIAAGVQPLAPAIADARGRLQVVVPEEAGVRLMVRLPAADTSIAEDVTVRASRRLTAQEIVARHQAVAARQDRLIDWLITRARTTVTFELPAFPAPVTVQADTTILRGPGTVELAQRNIRVNGIAFDTTAIPRLPLIEPERVAALPLAITLDRAYTYRLSGRGQVRGRDCYAIAFEPADRRASLFRGTAWIDAETFALVKTDAVQTNLRGPITSSQQIDEFAPQPVGSDTAWLLARSEIRQIYQGAGVTTPIHRVMEVERHDINPAEMQARRAEAARGAVMLQETPDGLRYEERGRASRLVTLAGGVWIDPNISQPLPFAGVNYTDFDLFRTGAQFNAFFGGAYGQFALNAPSIGGSRWQFAASGFAMLARYNDRAFRGGRERYEENLRQRPARLAAGVVRPLTARTTVRAEYLFDHVALEPGESTAGDFLVPADQVVHGSRLAVETQRFGWRAEAWWNPARRAGWRAWGRPGGLDYARADADFQRFGVSLYRPWVLSPRLLARVDLAWMAGRDLDRFSRYAFGTFENRLRGYPAASIRYDRGGALRTALAWQPGRRLRLDGFADVALVRDPGFGRRHRTYPAIGAALEAPGPFGLLLGAEWGYGLEGVNRDGSRGTHVVRITAYKLF